MKLKQPPSSKQSASSEQALPEAWVGIDVSKDTLDAAFLAPDCDPASGNFPNDKIGFAKLLKWAGRLASGRAVHFCMEATGSYSFPLAEHLAAAGRRVSVANPFLVKHYGLSRSARGKTDKADGQLLADYCRREQPPLWRMAAPEVRELTALVRHLDNLKQLEVQQRNRLAEASASALVSQSMRAVIDQTRTQIAAIEKAIAAHIQRHPGLKADLDLLESIPGVGPILAASILAELPDVSQFPSAQAAAAYRASVRGSIARARAFIGGRACPSEATRICARPCTCRRCAPCGSIPRSWRSASACGLPASIRWR